MILQARQQKYHRMLRRCYDAARELLSACEKLMYYYLHAKAYR
jgi:hypothetical protein